MPLVPPSVVMLGPSQANGGQDGGQDDVNGDGPDDLHAGIWTAGAAIAARIPYDDQLFDRAPELVAVCRSGIGCDTIDFDAANRRGVAVCNVPDGPTVPTAEHSLALIMTVAKQVIPSASRLRSATGGYYRSHAALELDVKMLGLVGFGRIARRVAAYGAALGMKPIAYDPFLPADAFPEDVARATSLDELLAASDVVSVHVPMTSENARMFNADRFANMKSGAVFVNAARGGLVDQDALMAALDNGHLLGAGLDVTDPEPLDPGHPLLHHPKVIVTPHVASATDEARARMFGSAVNQALMVMDGKKPPHLVNPEVWDKVLERLSGTARPSRKV